MQIEINIPYRPNHIQKMLHQCTKQYSVWNVHRAMGKSVGAVNEIIRWALTCDEPLGGTFIYLAPLKKQAKRISWNLFKFYTKNIPDIHINEAELSIYFPQNRSIIYVEGADEPDHLRGSHFNGLVVDEVAQMKRSLWYEAIFPTTQRRNARVLFIGTPKGDNLFKELYFHGLAHPQWECHTYTVHDTDIYSADQIKHMEETMPKSLFEQEYLCKWDAKIEHTFYSDVLLNPENNIVGNVLYNPMYPVCVAFDLGMKDPTAMWFIQCYNDKMHFIDYFEKPMNDLFEIFRYLQGKSYFYSYMILPFDGAINQLSSIGGKSVADIFKKQGYRTIVVKKPAKVISQIPVVQASLYKMRFDREGCREGLNHLIQYKAKVDKTTGEPLQQDVHDAASHAADALRTAVFGMRENMDKTFYLQKDDFFGSLARKNGDQQVEQFDVLKDWRKV